MEEILMSDVAVTYTFRPGKGTTPKEAATGICIEGTYLGFSLLR
jgi:hypothetical protein